MAKIKKMVPTRIRKITGGKDPTRLVEEFMIRRGFDPDECLQQRTSDIATWSVPLKEEEELEITLEGLGIPAETTLYMGLNVFAVPIRDCQRLVVTALTLADSLIGVKLSLVNYDLVLSVTVYTANMAADELDYFYELITRQRTIVQDTLNEELTS
jgi:hypothetical protein